MLTGNPVELYMPSTPVNKLRPFRTWHFTSVLKSSCNINLELELFASAPYNLDKVLSLMQP